MLKKLINEYVYTNKKIIIGIFVCILIGIISGISVYMFTDKSIKDTLKLQMAESIDMSDNGEYIKTEIIYRGIKNNICYIFIMFIFSIMLYGSLLIYLLYIIKGIAIGIYISTLFSIFGTWWGLFVVLLLVILVNVVYLPAITFVGITLINYNLGIMEYKNQIGNFTKFSKIIFNISFGIVIIFSSIIVEQLMSNVVIKISKII